MPLTDADMQYAAQVAAAAEAAVDQIEQAGRGLLVAMNACRANTADINTTTVLAAVIAYVADAQRVLLEVHAPAQERNVVPRLLVPGRKG